MNPDAIEILSDEQIEAVAVADVPETHAGSGKIDLLPGIVRHGMLCEKSVRDQFAIQAKLFSVNQGDLLAAVIQEFKREDVKLRVGAYLAQRGSKKMAVTEKGKIKEALKKVDPKALEAFLKAQGIGL